MLQRLSLVSFRFSIQLELNFSQVDLTLGCAWLLFCLLCFAVLPHLGLASFVAIHCWLGQATTAPGSPMAISAHSLPGSTISGRPADSSRAFKLYSIKYTTSYTVGSSSCLGRDFLNLCGALFSLRWGVLQFSAGWLSKLNRTGLSWAELKIKLAVNLTQTKWPSLPLLYSHPLTLSPSLSLFDYKLFMNYASLCGYKKTRRMGRETAK